MVRWIQILAGIACMVWGGRFQAQEVIWLAPLRAGPMFRPALFPSTAGCIQGALRLQSHWMRVTEYWTTRASPFLTLTLYTTTLFPDQRNLLGAQIFYDRQAGGILNDLRMSLTYAHRIPFSEHIHVSIGLSAGLRSYTWQAHMLIFQNQFSPDGYSLNASPPPVDLPPAGLLHPLLIAGIGWTFTDRLLVLITAEHFYRFSQSLRKTLPPRVSLDVFAIFLDRNPIFAGIEGGGFWMYYQWRAYLLPFLQVRSLRIRAGAGVIPGTGWFLLGFSLFFQHFRMDYTGGTHFLYPGAGTGNVHEMGVLLEKCWKAPRGIQFSECPVW